MVSAFLTDRGCNAQMFDNLVECETRKAFPNRDRKEADNAEMSTRLINRNFVSNLSSN